MWFNCGPVDGIGRKAVKNSVQETLDRTVYSECHWAKHLWSALFEDEKVHPVLCLNMVTLLNLLPCNAVLNSGKRRKSHTLNVVSREGQKGPGMCWHNYPSALHSAGRVWIWWQPSVCWDCLWDCSKLNQMQSQHVSGFMDSDSSDSPYFHVLLNDWHPSTGHTTFDLGKMLKICLLPISCSAKLLSAFLKFQ